MDFYKDGPLPASKIKQKIVNITKTSFPSSWKHRILCVAFCPTRSAIF